MCGKRCYRISRIGTQSSIQTGKIAIREGGEAIKRAVLSIEDTTFLRLYYELSSFHNKLHQAVLEETYTALKEPPAPDLSGQSAIREGRNAQNYRITDDHLGEGGPKLKYQANITAIRLLKELEAAGRQASQEQQEILSAMWAGEGFRMFLMNQKQPGQKNTGNCGNF